MNRLPVSRLGRLRRGFGLIAALSHSARQARERMNPWLRCALPVLLSFVVASCSGASIWHVAVGGQGSVPRWNGNCDTGRADTGEGAVTFRNGVWNAVHPGRARIPCHRGAVVLDVRAVSALAVAGPHQVQESGTGHFSVRATDGAGHELMLGESAPVVWTLGPGLHMGSACDHMARSCLSVWQARVIADAPGATWVQAAFAGRTVRQDLQVTTRPRS